MFFANEKLLFLFLPPLRRIVRPNDTYKLHEAIVREKIRRKCAITVLSFEVRFSRESSLKIHQVHRDVVDQRLNVSTQSIGRYRGSESK